MPAQRNAKFFSSKMDVILHNALNFSDMGKIFNLRQKRLFFVLFAHFCTPNTNSVCLSARFLHKSEEMGFLLLMAFLLKNLHFLARKSAFSTFCPQFCGKPNAKKTRVKSVKIFTKRTFSRYVWRGQNHCLAREKVRPREGKIPTT